MWINYKIEKPELGIEVLAYSSEWIDEDYNPKGIRVGFQDFSKDSDGEFVSAKFCNSQDSYYTDRESKPEYWIEIKGITFSIGEGELEPKAE